MFRVIYCWEILQRGADSAAQLHVTLIFLLSQLPGATDKSFLILLPRAFFSKKASFCLKGILASVANNIHFPLTLLSEDFFMTWENAYDHMS